MKPIIYLFLLSFCFMVNKIPGAEKNTKDYNFELTVITPGEETAKFDLVITGFSILKNGDQIPFKLEEQNLKTPYKLNLKNGKYKAKINNKSTGVVILSKVQGIRDGKRMSAGRSDSNHPTLNFGVGGKFSVSDN
ncbi:MAG: hypothetical protein ABJ092_14775 [Gillisia sp.]